MTSPTPHNVWFIPIIKYTDAAGWTHQAQLEPTKTFAEVVDDMWSGQIEDITELWTIDAKYGIMGDDTQRLADALAEHSFIECERPYPALRKWLDKRGVDYFDEDGEAYDVAMRREHGTLNRAQQL